MLTQQDLIDRLNQLTLRYNLTWFDIKYDADKAITKINNFLGTKYPKLSTYLISPNDTYSVTTTIENALTEYEIIKEEYFHSIIIPYIAMEILSRDEEFTTIYNKYMTEVQEGLYDMFQKEFNRIPFEFRQNPDQGVFFGLDTAQGIIQHNERNLNIPTFKFRIYYYPNNNNINLGSGGAFSNDPNAYVYDEVATLQFPNITYASIDGQFIYTFVGWTREVASSGVTSTNGYLPGSPGVVMRSDLNLYAYWSSINTLEATAQGLVNIFSGARAKLVNLIVPEFIGGTQAKIIKSNFITNPPLLAGENDLLTQGIYLPSSIIELQADAFTGFKGHTILLNQGLTIIRTNAFASTPALYEIIIPDTVTTIEAGAFPVVLGKRLVIKTRILEINKPAGWAGTLQNPTWYAASVAGNTTATSYNVEVIWGYNG